MLGEGGPYHRPLWQPQRKKESTCGSCGKARVGVIVVLVIVGVVDGSGNY